MFNVTATGPMVKGNDNSGTFWFESKTNGFTVWMLMGWAERKKPVRLP